MDHCGGLGGAGGPSCGHISPLTLLFWVISIMMSPTLQEQMTTEATDDKSDGHAKGGLCVKRPFLADGGGRTFALM